jgi:ribosome recycling factor
MEKTILINELTEKMNKSISSLNHELSGLRTGRASTNLLDPVQVEAYGSRMPISQVATVTITDSRTLSVQVWDASLAKSLEKAIVDANLGVSVISSGSVLRVVTPILSEERRKELAKLAGKYGEGAKVSIRNIRRDGMEILKKAEKDTAISKDEHHSISDEIQKLTDNYVVKIDSIIETKEKEITAI